MPRHSMESFLREKVQIHSDGSHERWRDVVGYADLYRVSDRGRFKSLRRRVRIGTGFRFVGGKILKPRLSRCGYPFVSLRKVGTKKRLVHVHRLVLEAFVGPCPAGLQCRHLDGNPRNNHLENLCWGTSKENSQDRIRHGTQVNGERVHCSKLKDSDIPNIHREYETGKTCEQLGKEYGVASHDIKLILTGKIYKHCQPKVRAKIRPAGFQKGNRIMGKLTETARSEITQARERGESIASIAKRLGYTYTLVWNFLNGKTYR